MTRETKLALIIGFALILAVGVLISDHLAAVERAGPADLTLGSQREPVGTHLSLAPPLMEVQREPPPRPHQSSGPDLLPHERAAAPAGEPLDNTSAEAGHQALPPELAGMFEPVDAPIVVRQVPTRTADPTPSPATPPQRTHLVKDDESLWEIAEQYYRDGTQWKKLAAANPQAVNSKGHVRAGVTLTIPDTRAAPPPEARQATAPPPREQPAAGMRRTYTVQRGDTLSEIAMRELGSARRTREILDLNRDRIDEADQIRVGMVLRLPAK